MAASTFRRLLSFVTLVSAVVVAGLLVPRVNHAQTRYLTAITVTPANPTIGVGQTEAFSGEGTFNDASTEALAAGGTWVPTGSLTTPRFYHSATRLQDGTVLVVGGYNGSSNFASAERYYPASDTWVSAGSMTTARLSHTATLLPNGKVLVAGGIRYTSSAGTLTNTTELYDPLTNSWSAGAPLTLGVRSGHSAVLLGTGEVLVVAGLLSYPDCTYRATAELYDPATNSWAATGSLTLRRSGATTTLLANGKVLLAGGAQNGCPTPNNGLNQAEVYDPALRTWTVTGTLSVGRYNNAIALLPSGKVLLAGGYSTGGPTASADLYNPATGTFSLTGAMAAARVTTGGTGDNGDIPLLQSGQVLFAGGSNSSGTVVGSATLYDPSSGTWAMTGSLATARIYNTATLLQDGRVLVAGGYNGTTLASAEVYLPKVTWTSSNESVATIDQTGVATGLSTGTTTITVTSGGSTGSTTLTVAVDTEPPTTNATFPWPNANGWNRLNVDVNLDAFDSGGAVSPSGVQSITYALTGAQTGGGTFNTNNTSFTISNEGTTTVTYYATDNRGNVEASHTLTVNLDKTPPTLSGLPNITVNATSAAGAVVSFNPVTSDSLSGVDTVLVTQGLPSGSTFPHGTTSEQVTVTDKAGNSTLQSFSVTVNKILVSIGVSPSPVTLTAGQNNQQFTATRTYSDGSTDLVTNGGGAWVAAGTLATPRLYHTATLLQDGSVLIAGGYNGSTTFASAERYYPATGTWVSAGSMSTARLGHTATLLPNGKVLVAGGIRYPDNTQFSTTELYDPNTNSWSAGGSLTLGVRSSHSAVLLNTGKVLVVAGLQSYPDCTYRATAELYNPATNTWAATGSLHLARSSATTILLASGKVLLAGGPQNGCPTPNTGLNQAEVYDPASGTWTVAGSLSIPRYNNTITRLTSGKVLLAGGNSVGGSTASADLYDPTTNSFSLTGSLNTARANPGGTGDNGETPLLQTGQVLFAGGSTYSGTILGNAELYDPTSGTWTNTGSLLTARTFNTATLLQNGKVLVVGGLGSGSATLGSVELYTPPGLSWASSNGSVATINQTGLATAVGSGTTTITATSGSISGSASLTVDATAPTTTATPSPAPNAAGWNNTDVTVTLNVTDEAGGTGVQAIVYTLAGTQNGGPFTVAGNSAIVSFPIAGLTTINYHAVDNNGNVESDHSLFVKIDKTPPYFFYPTGGVQITATSSAGAVVNFFVSANDAESGVVGSFSLGPLGSGATFPVGATTETVTATDAAGNVATVTFSVVVTPGRPFVQMFGGNFDADGTPHPATATATDSSGTPVSGSFSFAYLPGGSVAPVTAGQYTAAASFTSLDPAFTNAFPWTTMAPDPDPKVSPAVAEINGKLYVQGFHQGVGQSSFAPRLSIYDPASNSWSAGTPPGIIRAYANAVAFNGKMYVAGGCVMSDCSFPTSALEIYDAATGMWSNGAAMPTARFGAVAGVIGNKLYVTGGSTPGYNPTTATEIYDLTTNTWTTGASIPVSRELAMGAVANGQLYVIGGYQRGGVEAPVGRVDVFNPTTGWTTRPALPTARYGGAAGVIGSNLIHVIGGTGAGNVLLGTNERYDTFANSWLGYVPMPTPRTYTSAGVVGSMLYVIDGFTGAQSSVTEAFDASLTTVITVHDRTAPVTTATPFPAPNAAGWNNTIVTVTLNATDEAGGTGVQSIVYSLAGTQNGGPFTVAGNSALVSFPGAGLTTLNYHAVDNSGNAESDHSIFIKIDQTPPYFFYPTQGVQANAISSAGAIVNFFVSAQDAESGVVGSFSVGPLASGATFPVGTTTETVTATDAAGNVGTASFNVVVNPPLAPPTLTASPTTVVQGNNANSITVSGTGAPNAGISLFEGASPIGGGGLVDASGNWSITRSFIVGTHTVTATQSSGSQTSGASSPVTVHVRPPVPNINSPSSVISSTSPASVALTGFGLYDTSHAPPAGATVTIFEGQTVLGTVVVTSNNQWSVIVQLAYGSHALTASQALSGETSDLSTPFTVSVNPPLPAPTLTALPTTVVQGNNITFSGTGVPGANVSLFDGATSIGGGIFVDGTGHWSASRNLIVGSHTVTATQSSGAQTSVASAPVTVHVRPSAPNISSPSAMGSATSPASVPLSGSGFYGNGQTPATGATVTIFEGPTALGTVVVTSNNQWAVNVQLAYGSHALTASQTLAGETSDLSAPFTVRVNPILTSISVTPSTASITVGHSQPFQATGHFSDGSLQQLPTSGSGGGSGGGGGGSAWQIQFPLAEALNLSACGYSGGGFTSQAFSASSGSGPSMFGTVSTSWGSPSIVQVGGTVTAQDVHLTLSCIPGNGSAGTIDASWTGTRFEGTWQFSGASGHATILGWSTKAPLSAPRFSLGAAAVNGLVYAIGGGNPSQPSPVEAYSPSTNSWSTVSQLPVSSEGPGVVALGGIIYVAGGHVSGGVVSGVLQAYNPAAGTWATSLAPMPTARAYPALVAAGGKLYAIGGSTGSGNSIPTAIVEQYNPVTNQWTTCAPMSTPRAFHVAGALNSDTTIVAAGGNSTATELYDVAGNTWTAGPAMISTPGGPAAAVVNNALFVFGVGGVQMFRPAGTQPTGWAGLASMPTSRGQLGVAAVGDVVYAIGGMLTGGAGPTATVEAFSTPLPSNFQVSSGSGGGGGGGGSSSLPVVSWQSASPSIAGISSSGFASGNAAGQTTIIATAAGVSCVMTNTCATLTVVEPGHLTLALAPGSAVFASVELVVIDPSTGNVVNGPFDVPFGQTQSIDDPNAFRLRFTAPIGYTVTPVTVDLTVISGDNVTIPLFFALIDTTPPTLTVPSSQTTEATSSAGAVMTFANATATDSGSGVQSVSCDRASGATFPLGTTTVHCLATDNNGNTASGSFDLIVVDTTPPTLALPANITVDASSPAGVVVTYTASATDIVSGAVAVNCVPSSGSMFPIGTSTVACAATDGAGNTASGSFTVLVQAAAAQVANLAILVQDFNLVQNIANSLDAKLQNILSALSAAQNGSVTNVCGQLGAFINETQAQSGKKLTVDQASQLILAATRIKAVVGCQ